MEAFLKRAGVVGAGTMGAGIAQVLALAGVTVQLIDLDPTTLETGVRRISDDLARGADRGLWSAEQAEAARANLEHGTHLSALATAQLVVEAIPERLDLKQALFASLTDICPSDAVFATNTSSLLVSAIASGSPVPERVIGLHFFNPAPRMRLVEVVPGVQTSAETIAFAVQTVELIAKQAIVARDGIGFIVNRCARPYYGEALKLVQEGVATFEQVDRICRLGGGFRMGPFELIDLIGLDVNFEISKSFYEQSFGEARWRPSPIQSRLAAAGRHGRKTGRGFYEYGDEARRVEDPGPPAGGSGDGRVVQVTGETDLAAELRARASECGFEVISPGSLPRMQGLESPSSQAEPWLSLSVNVDGTVPEWRGPRAHLCASSSLKAREDPGSAGFHLIRPLGRLVELTALSHTDPTSLKRSEEFFAALGFLCEKVGDAPGLVLGRIVAQLVNEAAFAISEGVGSPTDIDLGTTLGLGYPLGTATWRSVLGDEHTRAILDGLWHERHDERYRLSPSLV
jgi:3-hydroxybutyryl-CoA dehydrogenase